MNYRHSYHAGNFADVVKHIVLVRIIAYLERKPQPFRVIDTHAGAGLYDLRGVEAGKTGEWRDGIGRVADAAARGDIAAEVLALIEPYLAAVGAHNADVSDATAAGMDLRFYPGSPLIARHVMRRCDTLVANELHSDDASLLKDALKGTAHSKVMRLDAWTALKALLPPPERRGLVVIDPPYEKGDEFQQLADGLSAGLKRFVHGTFMVWYPVKDDALVARFLAAVQDLGCNALLNIRLAIGHKAAGLGLTETGVIVFNPPYLLNSELGLILPWLTQVLAEDQGARYEIRDVL